MSTPDRFLGFGLAAADLLLEVDREGQVTFALGAGEAVLGVPESALPNRAWHSLFDPADHAMVEAMMRGLDDGVRAGPVELAVVVADGAPARYATLTCIRLPQSEGAVSCVVSRAKERKAPGLQARDAFEARAVELLCGSPHELELAFVELSGLSRARGAEAVRLHALVAGVLRAQAYRGEAATPAGPDRFALVRARDEAAALAARRIERVLSLAGVEGVSVRLRSVAMDGETRPKQAAQALRYALNLVQQVGFECPLPRNLSEALDRALRAAMSNAGQLGAAIRRRHFSLAFQPVVTLSDGSLHHHEVLIRFGSENSPFPAIRMAEEMDLIESLDLAILDETLKVLRREPDISLAVNVSGRSIMTETFLAATLAQLGDNPHARGRLLFELTESAAVEDLARADRHIQALRDAGCEVCLDDFGAGAASLAYLQQLTLDLVKIDGRYIRDLQHGGREATFVRHLVNMCAELKVRTLAEMVETPEAEEAVRKAGVDYAQGWLYGRASETPLDTATLGAAARLRSGAAPIDPCWTVENKRA